MPKITKVIDKIENTIILQGNEVKAVNIYELEIDKDEIIQVIVDTNNDLGKIKEGYEFNYGKDID